MNSCGEGGSSRRGQKRLFHGFSAATLHEKLFWRYKVSEESKKLKETEQHVQRVTYVFYSLCLFPTSSTRQTRVAFKTKP
jgi:hypothetical protein